MYGLNNKDIFTKGRLVKQYRILVLSYIVNLRVSLSDIDSFLNNY